MPATYDVFLSYCDADYDTAQAFIRSAAARGIIVCGDRFVDGVQHRRDEFVDALKRSRVLLILFSAASNRSEQLLREIAVADRLAKPVILLRLQNAEPSGAHLYELAARQWIDLFPAGLDAVVETLAGRLRTAEGRNPAPPVQGYRQRKPARFLPLRWYDLLVLLPLLAGGFVLEARRNPMDDDAGAGWNFVAVLVYLVVIVVRNARQPVPPSAGRQMLGFGLVWLLVVPFCVVPDALVGDGKTNYLGVSIGFAISSVLVAAICWALQVLLGKAFRPRIDNANSGVFTSGH